MLCHCSIVAHAACKFGAAEFDYLLKLVESVRLFLTSQKAGGKLPYLYVMVSEKLLPPSFSENPTLPPPV